MPVSMLEQKFSLKCAQCGALGVPLRVDSQTPHTIVLALRCTACASTWTAKGDLPVFLAWVKPDRRRKMPDGTRVVH